MLATIPFMLPKGLLKEYSRGLSIMMRFVDTALITLAALVVFKLHFPGQVITSLYWSAICGGVVLALVTFSSLHLYSSMRGMSFFKHTGRILHAVLITALLLAGFAFLSKTGEQFSRLWFAEWMLLSAGLIISSRSALLLILRIMRKQGLNERRVVMIGAGDFGLRFATTIREALWTGFRILTILNPHESLLTTKHINQIPIEPMPKDLASYLKMHDVDEVWITLPFREEKNIHALLHQLRHNTITVRYILDIFSFDLLNHSMTEIAGVPVLNINSTPMIGFNRLIKAIEDRIIASLILILIAPLLALIAVGVKLTSKGPILFKQKRHGWDGRIIKVYKFRTMFQHQECDPNKLTQATSNDARVTPLGRLLRKTSLDELPQFINVLQGQMSIVGPRPHAILHNEQYKDVIHTYMQRHQVKPGITGWAQVNGWRGETNTLEKMEKRVEYDLYYISHWSLGFDLKIIFLTIFRGFINRNAY